MTKKEIILELAASGKKQKEICEITGFRHSLVSYHLSPRQRESMKRRIKNYLEKNVINQKYYNFIRYPKDPNCSYIDRCGFKIEDLKKMYKESPYCYLSGRFIDINNKDDYSLDHIIPVSRGGTTDISNVAFCCSTVNQCKDNLLNEEFFEMCKKVLEHNGYIVVKKEVDS